MYMFSVYCLASCTYRPVCTRVLYIAIIPDCLMVLFGVQCSVAVCVWCVCVCVCACGVCVVCACVRARVCVSSLITIGSCACCVQHRLVQRAPRS